jgi:hypothetical protein
LRAKNSGGTYENAFFDIASGVVGTAEANWTNLSIEDADNGWFRISGTIATGGSPNFQTFGVSNADATVLFLADGASGVYLWGAQVE